MTGYLATTWVKIYRRKPQKIIFHDAHMNPDLDEMLLLARAYVTGNGLPINIDAAYDWYVAASVYDSDGEIFYEAAQVMLQSKDTLRAERLMMESAKQGHPKARLYVADHLTENRSQYPYTYSTAGGLERAVGFYQMVTNSEDADFEDRIKAALALAEIYQSGFIREASDYYYEAYSEKVCLESALDCFEHALQIDENGEFRVLENYGDEIERLRLMVNDD